MSCSCPTCQAPITARDILCAPFPTTIRCSQCGIRLVGNAFIIRQGYVVLLVAMVCASLVVFALCAAVLPPLGGVLGLLVFLGGFSVVMTRLTLRYGRYSAHG